MMKPEDFIPLLEGAQARPWRIVEHDGSIAQGEYAHLLVDIRTSEDCGIIGVERETAEAIVAVMNRAHLLVGLWGAVGRHGVGTVRQLLAPLAED